MKKALLYAGLALWMLANLVNTLINFPFRLLADLTIAALRWVFPSFLPKKEPFFLTTLIGTQMQTPFNLFMGLIKGTQEIKNLSVSDEEKRNQLYLAAIPAILLVTAAFSIGSFASFIAFGAGVALCCITPFVLPRTLPKLAQSIPTAEEEAAAQQHSGPSFGDKCSDAWHDFKGIFHSFGSHSKQTATSAQHPLQQGNGYTPPAPTNPN